MIPNPDQKEFIRLTKEGYRVIPVYMTVPADLETPVSIYLKLTDSCSYSFLLESGDLGEKARYSFIGCEPFITLEAKGGKTFISEEGCADWQSAKTPLHVLKEIMAGLKVYLPPGLETFWGGAVGYLSYDMVKEWEKIPANNSGAAQFSRCGFFFPRKVLIYDHRKHLLTIVYVVFLKNSGVENTDILGIYEEARLKLHLMVHNLRSRIAYDTGKVYKNESNLAAVAQTVLSDPVLGSSNGNNLQTIGPDEIKEEFLAEGDFCRSDFMAAVEKSKEYIRAGDIFQVVLSRRVCRELKTHPFSVYRALRSLNPSPYQFYFSGADFQLVGASPEMLVSLRGGIAATRPIAGTRPRGKDDESDQYLAKELSHDEKERAEHMMLVDLGRNDLGRVCEYGSVIVGKLLEVEYYSHVIHLISEVTGRLRPEYDFADLIRAAFPAGTVSGAPKVRAMEIIAETEPVERGPYAGAVGYVGFNGEMDICITIRTIVIRGKQALIQAGAGIVADSDPAREYAETEYKMAGQLKAMDMAEELEKNDPYR